MRCLHNRDSFEKDHHHTTTTNTTLHAWPIAFAKPLAVRRLLRPHHRHEPLRAHPTTSTTTTFFGISTTSPSSSTTRTCSYNHNFDPTTSVRLCLLHFQPRREVPHLQPFTSRTSSTTRSPMGYSSYQCGASSLGPSLPLRRPNHGETTRQHTTRHYTTQLFDHS